MNMHELQNCGLVLVHRREFRDAGAVKIQATCSSCSGKHSDQRTPAGE